MAKVVAYARVSTDKQDAENQRFEIGRYAAAHSLEVSEYVHETISGTKPVAERLLGELLKTLSEGDTLIVSETSRISRRLNEIFSVIQDFIANGVTVIAVKQNFVFGNDIQSKVIAFAFGLASEIERDLIASRTKEAMARLKSEGKILGRPKGTGDPTKRKLHGRDEEILGYMKAHVARAAIARLMEVNIGTLTTYIEEQNLAYELRNRELQNLMKLEGTWKAKP